jgi:signal transduction histidine kinase
LDAVAGFASLVWAPAGISLAAVLLFGPRVWPGITLGAVIANWLVGAPLVAAIGIGIGNTLEGLIGASLLRSACGPRIHLDRVRDVTFFVVLAAGTSAMIAATIGVVSLSFAGVVSGPQIGTTWWTWWLGDLIGDLLVVPLALTWAERPRVRIVFARAIETIGIALLFSAATTLVFGESGGGPRGPISYAYLFFPPLVWVALRFDQRGVSLATLAVAAISVSGTVLARGPFIRDSLSQSLFAAQVFLAVTTTTFLILGAAIVEQRQTQEDLRRARDLAAEANRAKSDFLAVVSHELRTPLNAISGYAELLQMGVRGPVAEEQHDFLRRIQQSAAHLLSLIEDVMSFAKLEAGRLSLATQNVAVNDSLDSMESLVAPEMRRKGLTLTRMQCDVGMSASADPEKLRQILLNLVGNAVKFTPPGGRVTVGADRSNGAVRIWVTDTGIGIPADQLNRVFEPFFQVERGTTRAYPGLGLGLAISRDLARAMRGDIQIESGGGRGCTATLTLPSDES